ncbi:2,5-diketo-D-gluconate reductase A, partial [Salmonella enterica subsp. enterica serovar Enteritidis str. 13183-1]
MNYGVGAVGFGALEVGYRSIDTATAYQNEEGVGKALKAAS